MPGLGRLRVQRVIRSTPDVATGRSAALLLHADTGI
jgi:hypothetical protein